VTRAGVLAVDGGNSKTDVALVNADGEVLALVRGALSSPQHLGLHGAQDEEDGLLCEALREAQLGLSHIHITAYERLAAEASVGGDPAVARKALLTHPLIGLLPLS
jgi:N-acetylglucosamine kinase-like BadF-type ATPase